MSDSVSITSSQRSGDYTTIKKGARITNAEIDALETYQITLGINESLRKGEPLENNEPLGGIDDKKLFKNLKSLLSKSTINETITVYRGIKIGYDDMEEVLDYFKQSPVIKEFLSTTINKSVATHFMGGGKHVKYNKERDVFYPMFGDSIDKSEVDKHDIIKKGKDTFLRDMFPCCFFEIELPKGTNAVYLPDFNTITGTLDVFVEEDEILVMPGGRLMYLGSRVEVGKEFEHYPSRKTNKKEKEELVSSRTVYQFRYVQDAKRSRTKSSKSVKRSKSKASSKRSKSKASPKRSKSKASPKRSKSKASPKRSKSKASPKRSKSKASPKRSKSKASPKRSKSKASPKRSKSKASPKRSKSKAKKDCPDGQTRDRITKECRPKKAPGRPKKV